jgi:hypothetical protein
VEYRRAEAFGEVLKIKSKGKASQEVRMRRCNIICKYTRRVKVNA